MFSRRYYVSTPWIERAKYSKTKKFETYFRYTFFISFLLLFLWFFSLTNPRHKTKYSQVNDNPIDSSPPVCDRGYSVYAYKLPPEFNSAMLDDCSHLNIYTDMCPHVANFGLGQRIFGNSDGSWFATHQFTAEMIFHTRILNHPCRTLDPTQADIFYVPFYGGLHASSKFREVNHTARDELAVRLVDYLQSQPAWQKHGGRDHFLALGRTAWDFMRNEVGSDFGANILLNLPPVQNMSVLTVERHPWRGSNQQGIPYPSYFHPHSSYQMLTWQKKMRTSDRHHLFSFIGAPRKGVEKAAIRDELITQCGESTRCKLLKCENGPGKCHNPEEVMKVMTHSVFCLQAPGDSFTRRSTFDSVAAGCIPVFFSPHTAYTQYEWYFPREARSYSVYIDEKEIMGGKKIEEELLKIGREKVERMRSVVISLMPRVTYAHPNSTDVWLRDAVDVALKAMVAKRIGIGDSSM